MVMVAVAVAEDVAAAISVAAAVGELTKTTKPHQ